MKIIKAYYCCLIFICFSSYAQTESNLKELNQQGSELTGPTLPCPECQQDFTKPVPYSGSWFNPEQSGSGFLIDVQNDILAGYYFGYDAAGKSQWAIFTGQLQDASDQGALWKVNASMDEFSGGACINCEYQAPAVTGSLGQVEIVFNRMAHASFTIDGGEAQNIVPLYFGYSLLDYANQQPQYHIPELEGWWSVFIDEVAVGPGLADPWSYINYMIHINKSTIGGGGQLAFTMTLFGNPPELIDIGRIECRHQTVDNSNLTKCVYLSNPFFPDFEIDPANISADRIYGEAENGDRVEMIRTSSDYCLTVNRPEDCVNTGIFDYLDDGSD